MAMNAFGIEVWAKYGVAMFIMIVRFIVRWKMIGWRNFDGTDFWCVVSASCYTIVSTCDYLLSTPGYPTNIGLDEVTAMQVPDSQIPAIVVGSKIAHFSWTIYICMIFSFKGVMLCLFRKLGTDIWRQEVLVRVTSVIVIVSWLASVLTHLLACLPIERFWQVKPYPGPFCTTRPQNYYVAGILNMVTDAMIIAIPMPMLWRLQVRLRRKLALGALFCSGIFIIICSVLRTIYSLSSLSEQQTAEAWAGREGFVSMLVVSAPGLWPLVRNSKWFTSSDDRYNENDGSGKTGSKKHSTLASIRWPGSRNKCPRDPLDTDFMDEGYQLESSPPTRGMGFEGFEAHSRDNIISSDNRPSTVTGTTKRGSDGELGMPITVTTEYTIQHETINPSTPNPDNATARRTDW